MIGPTVNRQGEDGQLNEL